MWLCLLNGMLRYYNSGPILKRTPYQISTQVPAIWTHFCNYQVAEVAEETQLFSLRIQEKQWQSYLKFVVMFHPLILVLVSRIPLWLIATNRIHMGPNLLVHVAAVQEPQMLSILRVSGFCYTVCKLHAPYYVNICGLCGSNTFFTLFHNTIFCKMLLNIKCVFSLSLQPLPETFLILRRL
jgi:hypothetical protein